MRSSFLTGALCVAGAAFLWGTAGTAQTFLDAGELSPLWVAARVLGFEHVVDYVFYHHDPITIPALIIMGVAH